MSGGGCCGRGGDGCENGGCEGDGYWLVPLLLKLIIQSIFFLGAVPGMLFYGWLRSF